MYTVVLYAIKICIKVFFIPFFFCKLAYSFNIALLKFTSLGTYVTCLFHSVNILPIHLMNIL